DLSLGLVLAEASVPGPVNDLALAGDYLYAVTNDSLIPISLADGTLTPGSPVASPGAIPGSSRLFVGGGFAYATVSNGVNVFSLKDPSNPNPVATANTTQRGWVQVALNGSGLGVAVVGPNPGGQKDLSLYDFSDPTKPGQFITTFPMPASATAVSIYNG